MIEKAQARAEAIGARAAREAAERLALALAEIPGVTAEATAQGVVVSGRGLMRRAGEDSRLRWPGGLLR